MKYYKHFELRCLHFCCPNNKHEICSYLAPKPRYPHYFHDNEAEAAGKCKHTNYGRGFWVDITEHTELLGNPE